MFAAARRFITHDSRRTAVALALAAAALASPALAQFSQYVAPGSLAEREIPTKERLKLAMEEARWDLGPLRLAPWYALKDFTYINNVYATSTDQKSDFTATLGLGLHGYVPFGEKLVFGVYALPEYVWWKDLSNRRVWNGRYGAGLFGYFNRLTLEVTASDARAQQYASSELVVPVNVRDRRAGIDVELRVLGRLGVFGTVSEDQYRYREQDIPGAQGSDLIYLDRNERHAGGGLRFHFTDSFSLGVGVERIDTDFQRPERDRSNVGDSALAELRYSSDHLYANVIAYFPKLDPKDGSQFVAYDGSAGHALIAWRPRGRLQWQLYGDRSLSYSVTLQSAYAVQERRGVGVQTGLTWRSSARLFWETGTDRYVAVGGGDLFSQDTRAYGAAASVAMGRQTALVVQVSREKYTAPQPYGETTITRFQTAIQFGGGSPGWW